MIYDITKAFFTNIESYLLIGKDKYNYEDKRTYTFFYPSMKKGFFIFFHDTNKFINAFFIGLIIFLLNNIQLGEKLIFSQVLLTFILLFFIFSVIFSSPSSMSNYGVSKTSIEIVLDELIKLNTNLKELSLIDESIKLIYNKFNSRVIFLRTILALLWTFNSFLITQNIFSLDLLFIIIYIVVLILFISVEFYKIGSEFVFKSISFTFIEYKYLKDSDEKHLIENYIIDDGHFI